MHTPPTLGWLNKTVLNALATNTVATVNSVRPVGMTSRLGLGRRRGHGHELRGTMGIATLFLQSST